MGSIVHGLPVFCCPDKEHEKLTALAVLVAMMAGCLATSARAAELIPIAQQNALVQKYCAVCHTDSARNGGLSLEHFDAAGGVSLEIVKQVDTNSDAAALVNPKMKSGAMGAAGIPIPEKATTDALIHAFAVKSAGPRTGSRSPAYSKHPAGNTLDGERRRS